MYILYKYIHLSIFGNILKYIHSYVHIYTYIQLIYKLCILFD